MKNKNIKDNKLFLTKDNVKELKEEFKNLKDVKRPKIIKEVKTARAQGDLSENAEYDAAKEKQAVIEKRIIEITEILNNYKLIETKISNFVRIGNVVKFKILDTNEIMTVKIGTSIDIDIENNVVSNSSVLGNSLLNKKKDDVVFIKNPGKSYKVKILEVK